MALTDKDAPAGDTAMDFTVAVGDVALLTVKMVAPVTGPILAAMLLAPSPTPFASPVAVMVAYSGCDVVQSDVAVTSSVLPSLMVAVALNCIVLPSPIVVRAGVTVMTLIVGAAAAAMVHVDNANRQKINCHR